MSRLRPDQVLRVVLDDPVVAPMLREAGGEVDELRAALAARWLRAYADPGADLLGAILDPAPVPDLATVLACLDPATTGARWPVPLAPATVTLLETALREAARARSPRLRSWHVVLAGALAPDPVLRAAYADAGVAPAALRRVVALRGRRA